MASAIVQPWKVIKTYFAICQQMTVTERCRDRVPVVVPWIRWKTWTRTTLDRYVIHPAYNHAHMQTKKKWKLNYSDSPNLVGYTILTVKMKYGAMRATKEVEANRLSPLINWYNYDPKPPMGPVTPLTRPIYNAHWSNITGEHNKKL